MISMKSKANRSRQLQEFEGRNVVDVRKEKRCGGLTRRRQKSHKRNAGMAEMQR